MTAGERIFRFSEHLASIAWLERLPPGHLADEVDLSLHAVDIERGEDEYFIYVGPRDPDAGGSALSIRLGRDLQLLEAILETLEPASRGERP